MLEGAVAEANTVLAKEGVRGQEQGVGVVSVALEGCGGGRSGACLGASLPGGEQDQLLAPTSEVETPVPRDRFRA